MSVATIVILVVAALIAYVLLKSIHKIGPAEVGLVNKRISIRKLHDDNPVAFNGEAGYQATLLMPGLRVRIWPIFAVTKFP